MESVKHFEYWLGWFFCVGSGMGCGAVKAGVYTPWALILCIPMFLTGFYLVVFKEHKQETKDRS